MASRGQRMTVTWGRWLGGRADHRGTMKNPWTQPEKPRAEEPSRRGTTLTPDSRFSPTPLGSWDVGQKKVGEGGGHHPPEWPVSSQRL